MFSFLSTLELAPVKSAVTRTVSSDNKNPLTADIRVFRNGSVYPSKAAVEQLNLAYTSRGMSQGNALDVIDSRDWPQYPATAPQQAVFIAVIPKSAPKTDLFGFTKYNEDNTPLSDVLTQGSSSFGKELLELLADVYETTVESMFHGENFVDLVITQDKLPASNGIYWFPKAIARGPKKGEIEMIRRENCAPQVLVYKGISNEYPREDGSYGADSAPVVLAQPASNIVEVLPSYPAFMCDDEEAEIEEEEDVTPFI